MHGSKVAPRTCKLPNDFQRPHAIRASEILSYQEVLLDGPMTEQKRKLHEGQQYGNLASGPAP